MPNAGDKFLLLRVFEQAQPIDVCSACFLGLLNDDLRLSTSVGRNGDYMQQEGTAGFLADTELAACGIDQQVMGILTGWQCQFKRVVL